MVVGSRGLRRRAGAGAVGAALVVTSLVATGLGAGGAGAAEARAGVRLEADLKGTMTGDPDGSGEAVIKLYKGKRKVCARVSWSAIETPNAAHIHRRSDGGVVVDLTGSVTDAPNCARKVPKKLIHRISEHPKRYYFNVHNEPYPAGAIQGRLHR
jgi:hypothetical protein